MLKVEELSGAQKAAVLLVQLGKEKSAAVLKSLRESEVEEVLNEIARLKGVPTVAVKTPDDLDAARQLLLGA